MQRILVVRLSALGDVVHLSGCVRAIRAAYPEAEITFAVDARFAAIAHATPHVDRVLEAPPPTVGPVAQWRFARRTLRALGDPAYDLAVDFQGLRRSAAWVYASRARRKLGRGGVRPGWEICRPRRDQHAILRNREVTEWAGIPVADPAPTLTCATAADAEVVARLAAAGLPSEGFVLVNPFSRWRSKEWPLDRFAALIDVVAHDLERPVAVGGGPGEEVRARDLLARVGTRGVANLVGALSLAQALCVYRRASVMVTGDTGPMHAAAALGTAVVALFGPSLPERSGPWGSGHTVIQVQRPPDQRAFQHDPDGRYMHAIELTTVVEALARVLAT